MREEARHLRDGEDDNEIEEELQGRDPLFALGLSIVHTVPGPYSPMPRPAPVLYHTFLLVM